MLLSCYNCSQCGVGLVVEHDLAKVETGVRFSYAAQKKMKKYIALVVFIVLNIFTIYSFEASFGGSNVCDCRRLLSIYSRNGGNWSCTSICPIGPGEKVPKPSKSEEIIMKYLNIF